MKVFVVINPSAGRVDLNRVVEKIKNSLFRCQLEFFLEKSVSKLNSFLKRAQQECCHCIVVVGGDGTINLVANQVKLLQDQNGEVPPLCLVSLGTANDLAGELNVHKKIEEAVHVIFSGKTEEVDLLKVSSESDVRYMLTNGGIGLTAETAINVNRIRKGLSGLTNSKVGLVKKIGKVGEQTLKSLGSDIYSLVLAQRWIVWPEAWKVKVQWDKEAAMITKSPFILVNNQKKIARRFYTAPSTSNNDGKFSLLILKREGNFLHQARNILKLGRGRWVGKEDIFTKEVSKVKISMEPSAGTMDFIGDGEVLHKSISSITVSCVHPGLKIFQKVGRQ